jgi:hypothetical protein
MNMESKLITDKKFISIEQSHEIDTSIIEDFCYLTIIKITPENYKTLLLLFKDIILYLKLKDVKYIKQFIHYEDVESFKKSTIYTSDDYNNFVWITTNIIDFMEEICCALNINHFYIKN